MEPLVDAGSGCPNLRVEALAAKLVGDRLPGALVGEIQVVLQPALGGQIGALVAQHRDCVGGVLAQELLEARGGGGVLGGRLAQPSLEVVVGHARLVYPAPLGRTPNTPRRGLRRARSGNDGAMLCCIAIVVAILALVLAGAGAATTSVAGQQRSAPLPRPGPPGRLGRRRPDSTGTDNIVPGDHVAVHAYEPALGSWELTFAAPEGERLEPRNYVDAECPVPRPGPPRPVGDRR